MKKFTPLVILVAIIATVALAARYEELLVGALKCDSIAGQPGKAAPTATLGAVTASSVTATGGFVGSTVTVGDTLITSTTVAANDINAAGQLVGPKLTIVGGNLQVTGTALEFVSTGGATNVLDADITSP